MKCEISEFVPFGFEELSYATKAVFSVHSVNIHIISMGSRQTQNENLMENCKNWKRVYAIVRYCICNLFTRQNALDKMCIFFNFGNCNT